MLGPSAAFRSGQLEAIRALTQDRARLLLVQRTGWGKSVVYWIATRIRRDAGSGPAIIISPLLALMRNQIEMAARIGVRALTVNTSNTDEWPGVKAALQHDECDVLLISPERLANNEFLTEFIPLLRGQLALFVVDEAHCISDWGHDFRPDYRRIRRLVQALPRAIPILATTATANDRVVDDVVAQLGTDVAVLPGPLARDSLTLQVISLADQAERLAWLAQTIPTLHGSGIVYCLTVIDTVRVATWLQTHGIAARAYNADLSSDEREDLERALLENGLKVLVATVALGMGFDKPDLGFVIHYQRPGSVVAYYQQVGRAGRAVDHAFAVLLSGREDDEISEYFIRTAFPPTVHMHEIVSELEQTSGMTVGDLQRRINLPRGQIDRALKLLELDGAVGRDRGRYFRTPNPWAPDLARVERVTQARHAELREMQAYVETRGCLMEYVQRSLSDPTAAPCGHCANDGGPTLPADLAPALVREAIAFLRRDSRPIAARRMWPSGAIDGLAGRIDLPNEPGFALSVYGDAGWGRLVQQGKYETHTFDPELVAEAARQILRRWRPSPAPTWVTAVPSVHQPGLVAELARGIATRLRLPFADVIAARPSASSQKEMQNSVQQLRNVHSVFSVVGRLPAGPVLLVDDIVDSGWTMTYLGWLLRHQGAEAVHPFALAVAAGRADAT